MTTNSPIIYIGSDHGGFELKQQLKTILAEKGLEIIDCGADQLNSEDDYPVFAIEVGERVVADQLEDRSALGVLLCRSGAGMSIAANKVIGVRAAQVVSIEEAQHARTHNNANVMTVAADALSFGEIEQIVDAFIATDFSGEERHLRRINLIRDYEKNRSKN